MKDIVIEEQVISGATHRRTQLTKVYGFNSSKNGREDLYDLITDRVNYHKDKIIEPRIHEQLCQLIWTKKGRIDHPDNGHDDMVIALALALWVLYRGGDTAREMGVVLHPIKTDAEIDEEVLSIGNDAEIISDKIEVLDRPEAQVDQQMQILDSAPGKMSYEEWRNKELEREREAVEKILMTKDGRDAYAKAYHIDENDINSEVMFKIPDSVFMQDVYDTPNPTNGARNLYERFMKVMSVR